MTITKGTVLATFMAALLLAAGCSVKTTGEVREDVTLTGERAALEQAGIDYRGPLYSVAILSFDNKTPTKTLGIGEAATDMLRTLVKEAGLEPVVLSEGEMREQERLIELVQSGAVKQGMRDPAEGFDPVDYRLTGSVTSYSEVAETLDVLIGKSKTVISKVQVDYALVDVATGKSLVADSGTGEYRKKTTEVLGIGTRSTPDPALRDGALRDALTRALRNMVDKLNAEPYRGRVLFVDNGEIVVRAGTRSRLPVGSRLEVLRAGEALVDPDTGRAMGVRWKKVGEIEITSHEDERVSHAKALSGEVVAKGDAVREVR